MRLHPFAAARIAFVLLLGLMASPAVAQMDFFTVPPCRLFDSRTDSTHQPPDNPLQAGVVYTLTAVGVCGVPAGANAVSLNVTVIGPTGPGELVVFQAGTTPPSAGAIPFHAGQTKAMIQIVALGTGGQSGKLSFRATIDPPPPTPNYKLLLDITGYFLNVPTTVVNDSATIPEDAAATPIDVLANDSDPDDTLTIVSTTDPANGTVVLTPAGPGPYTGLTYQPDANYCNNPPGTTLDTFTYTLNTGSTGTVDVTVDCRNDAPVGTDGSVGTSQGTDYTFAAADFGFTDPNDTPPNNFLSVVITTLPALGSLTLSGNPVVAGQEIPVASIPNLKFTPAGTGTPYTSFTFQVRDDGGTSGGGVDLDASANNLTINVNNINDAPEGTDNTVSTPEDTDYTFAAADFGFTDPNDTPPNNFQSVVITTLPGAGSLTLSGNPIIAGQEIPVASIPNLKFTPVANATGSPYTSFTFQVRDDGGVLGGGVDLDQSANTMTINVTPVNDPPAGTDNTVTTPEDTPYTFAAADFGFTDPIDSPANALQSVVITTLPGVGSLTLSGNPVVAGQEIPAASLGNLAFTPAANASGSPYTTFTFQVRDDGGILNGGVDLDQSANTMTINVTANNDAPAGTNNTVSTAEDTDYTFAAADFGFTDPNDVPPNNFQSVVITTLPALGSLTLSGNPVVAGQEIPVASIPNLKFTPVANGSGSPYTTFTFQVRDDGGILNGGVDLDQSANTMTINVMAVNDPPAGTNNTVSTAEDTPFTFAAANFGFTDPLDTPANNFQSVVITTLPGAGSLTLSGNPVVAGQDIPVASIGNLVFTPVANANGTPYTSFTFQVRDDGGGTDLDLTPNTMTINVTAVNDPPTDIGLSPTAVNENQPINTVVGSFTTSDVDLPSDTHVYTLVGGTGSTDNGSFNISGNQLRTSAVFNFEVKNSYSIRVQTQDQGGTGLTFQKIFTITVNDLPEAPNAAADTWDTIGNTELRVDLAAGTTPNVADTTGGPPNKGVLDNDVDEDTGQTNTLIVSGIVGCADTTAPYVCATTNGGTVTMESDGSFSFTPAAGNNANDSFTYIARDTTSLTANAVVTLHHFERVWYVDPNAAGGGNGTSSSPFNTLDSLDGGADSDGPSDYIFVHDGTLALSGPMPMEANQHLIGEGQVNTGPAAGFALSIPVNLNGNGSPTNLVATGTRPQLTNATGDAVTVGTTIPIEIVGLSLASTTGNAIDLTSAAALSGSSTLTISRDEFRGAGAEGIDVNMNASTTGTLNLNVTNNSWNVAGTHTGNAVDINRAAGTLNLNFSGNTNIVSANAAGAAVVINGGAVANTTVTGFSSNTIHQNTMGSGVLISNVTFDAVAGGAVQQVDGDNLSIGVSGDGVGGAGMGLTTVQGNLFFDDLDVYGASGLTVTGTGSGMTLSVTPASPDGSGTSVIRGSNGVALDVTSATIDLRLDDLDSTTSGSGLSLNTVAGQFKVDSDASITKSSGGGTAFSVASSVSGTTVTYAGTLNVTSGSGVSLTSNTGSTISFSGGMTLSTGGNPAFTATGGGTVEVCDDNPCAPGATGLLVNTLTTSTGTALNVANTTISANNLEFRSISAGTPGSGPTNGIVLNTTGSSGGLKVKGTGTAGSGGTIQKTSGHGINLTSTLSPSFDRMNIADTGGSGVEGTGVTNFSFTNGVINNSGTGGGADDSNIAFNNQAAGTENNLSGTVTITNNTLTNSRWHGIMIQNFNGTVADAIITGNTITSSTSAASSLGYGINLQILGSATTVSNLTKATISGNIVTNFPSAGGIQVQGGNSNAAGPAGILGAAGSGTNVISIVNNQVRGQSAANRMATSAILYTVSGKGQGNVDVSSNGTLANPIGNNTGTTIGVGANGNTTLTATTNNNFVEANHPGTTGDSGISGGVGVTFGVTDVADMTWTINGNTIRNVDGNGILAVARGTNGTLKVKIQNNDVEAPQAGVRPGIRIDAGNTTAGTDNDVCLNISGNTSAGSGGSQGIGLRKQGTSTTVHAFGVNGMAATSSPGVETYVNGLNPAGSGTLLISAASGFSNCSLP